MCLTVALQGPNVGLVATDGRVNRTSADGSVDHRDVGGKLVPLPNGFVAATGMAAVGYRGLDQMRGVDAADRRTLCDAACQSLDEYAPVFEQRYPDEDPSETWFFVAADTGEAFDAYRFRATGEVEDDSENVLLGWPFEEDPPAVKEKFAGELGEAESLSDAIRATGRLFDYTHRRTPKVGPDLDLGVLWRRPGGFVRAWRVLASSELVGQASDRALANLARPREEAIFR